MFISDRRIIKKYGKIADKIILLSKKMMILTDEELKNKTLEFKNKIKNGEIIDNLLIEAFAVAKEAIKRILYLNVFRVQLIGAIVLHKGDIAEMKTGEGKTITSLMPTYLNALTEKGVHIVTVNEYLAKRDAKTNGLVFNFLGLTVGLNIHGINKNRKKIAYYCDITYTTNSELGFDYLRDNIVMNIQDKVQRNLNYAIIDEADSILIDESRTPLVISGGQKNKTPQYLLADKFSKLLNLQEDLRIDLETKQAFLTSSGIQKAEKMFAVKSLFDIENTELYHLILNALKANFIFKNGIEYVVQNNEIILIDQFTGRLMPGRAYSDGLQQSLQAKECVKIEQETITMATITYQNFFRLYSTLSGMTGTAKTEEEEFIKIYNMRVIQIPTNKPIIRKDEVDLVFANRHAKLKAMITEILKINKNKQPILIGTTSVESSEIVAHYLKNKNLHFEMLNAKNHEHEAEIIAKAGQKSAITLATNMAGRGTDIKLGAGVIELGGLAVLSVERNEARRIDNQLRGRSGRQGDPGFSRFYVSIDDELMLRFGGKKLKKIFGHLGDNYIKSRMLTRAITNAQKKIEGINFDQRKNILEYDNVLAQHREAMYTYRNKILTVADLKPIIKKMQISVAYDLIQLFSKKFHGEIIIDYDNLIQNLSGKILSEGILIKSIIEKMTCEEMSNYLAHYMFEFYIKKTKYISYDIIKKIERSIIISTFDEYWTKHINQINKLRSSIYLHSYAQTNPLHVYVEKASTLYNCMHLSIANSVINKLINIVIKQVEKNQIIELTNNNWYL